MSTSYRYRGSHPKTRQNKKWWSLLVLLLVGLGVVALAWKVLSMLFGFGSMTQLQAEITIEKGRAEATLSEDETKTWSPIYDGYPLYAGDQMRSSAGAKVALNVEGTTVIYAGPSTEIGIVALAETKKGQESAILNLTKGQVWGRVSEEFQTDDEALFSIITPAGTVYGANAIFDVTVDETQTIVRAIQGEISFRLRDEDLDKSRTIGLSENQKAIILHEEKGLVLQGKEVQSALDQDFMEDEWNLENLSLFDPLRVNEIRREIELRAPVVPTVVTPTDNNTETQTTIAPPTISTPANGAVVPANDEDTIIITGKAPKGTAQISVSGSH